MNKSMETLIIKGKELEIILDDKHDDYLVINPRYKFICSDHDMCEFQAIIQRVEDNKFFKVNWEDSYSCSWHECGLDEDDFVLTEVIRTEKTITIYE